MIRAHGLVTTTTTAIASVLAMVFLLTSPASAMPLRADHDVPGCNTSYLIDLDRSWGHTEGDVCYDSKRSVTVIHGTVKDLCPGDGAHVDVWIHLEVRYGADKTYRLASTAGHTCGYTAAGTRYDIGHVPAPMYYRKARLEMCRKDESAGTYTCVNGDWKTNPYA